jgi:hypothetical protein
MSSIGCDYRTDERRVQDLLAAICYFHLGLFSHSCSLSEYSQALNPAGIGNSKALDQQLLYFASKPLFIQAANDRDMIGSAFGRSEVVLFSTLIFSMTRKQRLNRKLDHSSPSNPGFRLCEALRGVDSLHYRRTSPAIINCLRTIHRFDSAKSVTCWAVFFTKPRKRTLV